MPGLIDLRQHLVNSIVVTTARLPTEFISSFTSYRENPVTFAQANAENVTF